MSTEPATSAELMPVDFIETELTRFTAVIGSVKSKTFGRYGIEFITSRDQKDDVWECTDETGHEVVVVVYKRRVVGVPDPSLEYMHRDMPIEVDSSWQVDNGTE